VHVPTWISAELARLLTRHLGPSWRDEYEDPAVWVRLLEIPDEEIWAARNVVRTHLFQFMRERARTRWTADQSGGAARAIADGAMLDSRVLTIGFARRFTGYKRPDLLFRDPDRLARLVTNAARPVQFIFAGKAHPADEAGKHHLQGVFRHALQPRFGGRITFIEDYDLHIARRLVQGCDVWLNTPRKPLEASGTSGMKASMNGVLHLSIADGWWAEAYDGTNGWQIVGSPATQDVDAVDHADATALYDLLEREVVPTFYDRDGQGLPRRWLEMVKRAMLTITPRFSARRLVKDYVSHAYAPAVSKKGLSLGA
jgi:starch phosphorylase